MQRMHSFADTPNEQWNAIGLSDRPQMKEVCHGGAVDNMAKTMICKTASVQGTSECSHQQHSGDVSIRLDQLGFFLDSSSQLFCTVDRSTGRLTALTGDIARIIANQNIFPKTLDNLIQTIVHPEEVADAKSRLSAADTAGEFECRLTPNDLSTRVGRFKFRTNPVASSKVNLLDILIADITTTKQAHLEPSMEEARLRAVVQLNKTKVSSDREFMSLALKEILAFNSSACGFLALLSEDSSSLTIPSWTQPEGTERLIANRALVCSVASADSWVDAVCTGDISINNEAVRIDPLKRGYPGGHTPIRRQMSIPVFADDKIVAVAGVANKMTPYTPEDANQLFLFMQEIWPLLQQHRDRGALEESEKRYRLLVESMNEGLGAFDENCNVTYANERFCRMLGYAKYELVGKSAAAFLDEHDQELFYDRIAHNKDEGYRPYEVVWKTKQGADLPAIVSPQALFDLTGNFVGSFAVVTDISRLKKTEEELRTANTKLEVEQIALHEKNVALREVMSQIDNEKKLLQRQLQTNIDRILTPIITKLQKRSSRKNDHYLTLLNTCINDIAAPFVNELDRQFDRLSPRELEICNLIKSGLSTAAIAETLSTSIHTVNNQRKKIRRKLKLAGESSNLKVFLQSV